MSTSLSMKLSVEQRLVLIDIFQLIESCDRKMKSVFFNILHNEPSTKIGKEQLGTLLEIQLLVKHIKFGLKQLGIDEDHAAMKAWLVKSNKQIAAIAEIAKLQGANIVHLNSKFNVATGAARH